MPSSAPGATIERTRGETRRGASMALGVFGGVIGGLMALVFAAYAIFGSLLDLGATRAEETAVMAATIAMLVLSIVGAVGGSTARTEPGKGAALQILAALGGVVVVGLMALVKVSGLGGDESNFVDALWLVVGFWSIPAVMFGFGAGMARAGAE